MDKLLYEIQIEIITYAKKIIERRLQDLTDIHIKKYTKIYLDDLISTRIFRKKNDDFYFYELFGYNIKVFIDDCYLNVNKFVLNKCSFLFDNASYVNISLEDLKKYFYRVVSFYVSNINNPSEMDYLRVQSRGSISTLNELVLYNHQTQEPVANKNINENFLSSSLIGGRTMNQFIVKKNILLARGHTNLHTLPDDFLLDMLRDLRTIEGGYSNYAEDSGGETYAGITRKNHPHFSFFRKLDSLYTTKEYLDIIEQNNLSRAKKFSLISCLCDKLFDQSDFDSWCDIISHYLKFSNSETFDSFIKISEGCGDPVEFIEQVVRPCFFLSVNSGNNKVVSLLENCRPFKRDQLIDQLITQFCKWYISIIKNKPDTKIFMKGWQNRLILSFKLTKYSKDKIYRLFKEM